MKGEGRDSLWRIVDANLNRVAEALRVVEDVCRFHWELGGLAAQLKGLRHSVLGTVEGHLPRPSPLLAARDSDGDVGRHNESPGAPEDAGALARRNLQRAREALRVLEEAAKIVLPGAAPALEEARYRLYSAERTVGRLDGSPDRSSRLASAQLCLLATAARASGPLEAVVAAAIDGGVSVVQLREKGLEDASLLRAARQVRELTLGRGALFVVNDRPDIALLSRADGVHLGQTDLPPGAARQLLAPGMLVGVSTHSLDQALQAERDGADYVGVGPVFPSATKDAGPALGPETAGRIASQLRIPAFAIGGIAASNVREVAAAGLTRVAVSAAVLGAGDAGAAAAALLGALGAAEPRAARRPLAAPGDVATERGKMLP